MPVDDAIDKENEEFLKAMDKEPWATSEESLNKQSNLYKEDLKEVMPEFALEEEDKEYISY